MGSTPTSAILYIKGAKNRMKKIIKFYTTWCNPCKAIKPVYEELSQKYKNIVFEDYDAEETQQLAESYNVKGVPLFIFLKGGEVVDRVEGANVSLLNQKVEKFNNL